MITGWPSDSAAVELFRAQGFNATTVEQIAEAAEVAPSTVFRYFPTKEDIVVPEDDLGPFLAAFQAQPPELSPLEAIRRAFQATLSPSATANWMNDAIVNSASC